MLWQLCSVGHIPYEDIGRQHPAVGVHIHSDQPTVVLLTVCTKDRSPSLANAAVHQSLRAAWQSAQAWLIGYYLLMPDHVHLFCAPHDPRFTVEKWVAFWKKQFRRLHQNPDCRWQAYSFHHRLRQQEDYTEKWTYVRENPVRKRLVEKAAEWPHQGMMNVLPW
jgi:putative transposase